MNEENMLLAELKEKQKQLHEIIPKVEKRLSSAPEGKLRIMKHGKGVQYFHRTEASPEAGVYIPAADFPKAQALAQKRYDELFVKAAKKQASQIEHFLKHYDPDKLIGLYEDLPESRKKLITPAVLPDREYAEAWLAVPYTPKPFAAGDPEHYDLSGLRVRSKSEALIRDTMAQMNVLNKYECPIKLGKEILHPDFTILRMSDRKIIYWEHLGRMDDYKYVRRTLYRLRLYEKHKIFPGENLILTMETSEQPLNTTIIKMFINHYDLSFKP